MHSHKKPKSAIPILYEDDFLIAISKPPRIASVPGSDIPRRESVLGKIELQYKDRGITPYILHRLDSQTSGVMLFGKHEKDRKSLEEIFRRPDTQKKYIALVKGLPRGKIITRKLESRSKQEAIPAQTNFKVLRTYRLPGTLAALVEAEIKTGRKHQIRKHFASIGCPVILDSIYGDPKLNRNFRIHLRLGRQFLHAASIHFFHPFLKKHLTIEAPLPPDLKLVLKRLTS